MKIKELEVKKIPVSDIKFDVTNPNVLTDKQMDSLKKLMKKYGYLAPVILNSNHTVIDGEHRVRAYQEMGKTEIPAYVIDVTKIDLKVLRQLMNKLRGEHDKQKDAEEFKAIFEAGKLDEFSELMAKEKDEFEQILEKKFGLEFERPEESDIPKVPKKPKAKLGDIYQLGDHKIMCGDSTKDIDKLMKKNNIQLLFTDPPYGLGGYAGRSGKFNPILNDNINTDVFYNSLPKNIPERYVWGNWFNIKSLTEQPRDVIIWKKNNFGMGKGYRGQYEICMYFGKFSGSDSDVWEVKKDNVSEYKHPTQKPTELCRKAIVNSSKQNDIVLDPYLGSGSTLIACEQTGRICYGMELDPGYIDVIIQRWENYTGKKAKKL